MYKNLLLEIGTEEKPANIMSGIVDQMHALAGDKLDEADKSNVNAKIAALKDAMNKGTDAMKTAQTELEQAVYSVSEKLYKNAAPQGDPNAAAGGQPGGRQPSGDNGNNGNVYDADFKDVD